MTIGELLKEFRLNKEKTQREWIGDIVSPSFYSKVEKNIHRISAEDLVAILHVNKVPLIDFFSKLNKRDQARYQQGLKIGQLINEAYYQNSKSDLQQIRKIVANSDLPDKDDNLLFIDAYIAMLGNDFESLDKDMINRMKEKVFSISNFDGDSLSMYCNFMAFYDLDSNLIISKKVIEQFIDSNEIRIQRIVLSIIDNMLTICIQDKRYDETSFFLEVAKQVKIKPEIFFYKAVIVAFDNLIKYHYEHDQKCFANVKAIIKTVKLAGMKSYGKDLEELLLSV